jgi:WD40 repeat protein
LDGQIIVWDMTASKVKKPLTPMATMQAPIQQSRFTFQFKQSSNELITLGADKKLTVWSLLSKKVESVINTESEVSAFVVSPDD